MHSIGYLWCFPLCGDLLISGRIAKAVLQGHGGQEVSSADLDKAVREFNSELVTFGTSIGFHIFATMHGTTL